MNNPEKLQDRILDQVRQSPHKKVKVAIPDIDGVLRGKYMHKDKFFSAAEKGFGFCDVVYGWDCADVCYDNVKLTGWHTGYPDVEVSLDLNTFRRIPWENNVPFFIADSWLPDGGGATACPRRLLRNVVQRTEEAGYKPMFGMEFEWFNFSETPKSLHEKGFQNLEPLTPGMFGYSILRAGQNSAFFTDIMDMMGNFNVPIEGLHTETGPGVFEVAIRFSDALEQADRATLFKNCVKEIAHRHGIMPTFMARIDPKLPGCSGHLHQSLCSPGDEGRNLFRDDEDSERMSDLMRHYIAGQLHCLGDILPMFAPTVNSYKRLCEGYWAPTRATWSIDNRTVALRAIPGGNSTRLETRVPGSDVNPYLAISAALASGLYGIVNKLELTDAPVKGNGYETDAPRLPGNLHDAATRMAASPIARELFGDDFVDHYTATRLWEWRQFQQAVTDWEKQRYFEII